MTIPGGQRFQPRAYQTPGDAPSAAALVAAARALGTPLRLKGWRGQDEDTRALVAALDALGVPLAERPGAANGGTLAILGGADAEGVGLTRFGSWTVTRSLTAFQRWWRWPA